VTVALKIPVCAQPPFQLQIKESAFPGFPALQSMAVGVWNNHWILIGGRTDGLHKRQPFASFSTEGMNRFIYVVNVQTQQVWKHETANLPAPLREQLQSSNMQFAQHDSMLVLTGGYSYSYSKSDHITHPYLTVVQLPRLLHAIKNGGDPSTCFLQKENEAMAVTGGRLAYANGTWYLAGGQKFTGRYNPHGPDHGPGFEQVYTNAIRRFMFNVSRADISISLMPEWRDTNVLHRRDYNLLPQHKPDGSPYFTMYSGVFRPDVDQPFTTLVHFDASGFNEQQGFAQYYNHYHTAALPAFSKKAGISYAVFFGGIAQYYVNEKGKKESDNNVPFVNTISVVERGPNGTQEHVLPVNMPALLGASAEFVPASTAPFNVQGVLDMDNLGKKPLLVGYIIGGIESDAPNVFWGPPMRNDSRATGRIFEVYVSRR